MRYGSPRGGKWPPSPPDVKLVRLRVGNCSSSFTDGFNTDFVDGEPFFDQPRCVHSASLLLSLMYLSVPFPDRQGTAHFDPYQY